MVSIALLTAIWLATADGLGIRVVRDHGVLNNTFDSDNPSSNPWCHRGHLLPNIFMLGMQKAGSSSIWMNLVDYLPIKRGCGGFGKGGECEVWGQMEPLYMKKELHFFDDQSRYEKGVDFYTAHYPQCKELKNEHRGLDGTPNYLGFGEKAAQKMVETYGEKKKDLKFLLIVRDPVKRMEAGYWHIMPNHGGGFEEFVEKSYQGAVDWMAGKAGPPWDPNPYHGSLYARALKEWLKVFDPSQFTVVTLDQYSENPDKVMNFLANRLGMKKRAKVHEAEHRHDRQHKTMSDAARSKLQKLFAEDQAEFNDLVTKHCMSMGCEPVTSHL